MPKIKLSTAVVVSAFMALAACGEAEAPSKTLPEKDVEAYASSALEKEIGVKVDKIDCPDAIRLEDGEEMRCTLTHENDSTGMTVTVSDVDGTDFHLDVEVDEKGTTVAQSDLEAAIAGKLEEQTGDRPADVACPGAIQPSEGVTVECVLTAAGGERYGAVITVTGNDGTTFDFGIKVDSEPM